METTGLQTRRMRKSVPGISLPVNLMWRNPAAFSPIEQLQILKLSLKEPLNTYQSDFDCLGNWKGTCGKESFTRSCILRGFCHFWQERFPEYSYGEILLGGKTRIDYSAAKTIWRQGLDVVWKGFVDIILWYWVIKFYDYEPEQPDLVWEKVDSLLDKPEAQTLLNLEKIVEELLAGKRIEINLGSKIFSWEKRAPFYLTLEKDLVFGIKGREEQKERMSYQPCQFLLALKYHKIKIRTDQLIKHLQNWFFSVDPEAQGEWVHKVLPEVRADNFKLLSLEKNHPFGPLLRYWKSHYTEATLQLAILVFQAQKGFLEGGIVEEFSEQMLDKIYELEKLKKEGRTFWDNWEMSLYFHIGRIMPLLIFYSKREKVPISPEKWLEMLKPQKERYFNFLFWLKEEEKAKVLKLLKDEFDFLIRYKYIGEDGKVNREEIGKRLSYSHFVGLKKGLRSLAKELSWN